MFDPTTLLGIQIHRWREEAECRNSPELFDFDPFELDNTNENAYPTQAQKDVCDRCPVRVQCLTHALVHDEKGGIWGGTTAYQRKQLLRKRSRSTCPDCGGDRITEAEGAQICLTCAVSWSVPAAS
jgi:WhiB family transcriptional regulator, redox-sensing transcriptional regulator